MRWSIIRLIWLRELRDQLRDRRTVFMIAVLPILIYPVAGFGLMQLALGFLTQKSVVGVVGVENLVPWSTTSSMSTPTGVASWFACTPAPPGAPLAGVARLSSAAGFHLARSRLPGLPPALSWLAWTPGGLDHFAAAAGLHLAQPSLDYPPLLEEIDGKLQFSSRYVDSGPLSSPLRIRPIEASLPDSSKTEELPEPLSSWVEDRTLDVLVIVPPGFQGKLQAGEQPQLYLFARPRDDTSRLVKVRVESLLQRWRGDLKEVRLARAGLPRGYDNPFTIYDPEKSKSKSNREEENLFSVLMRVFPFVLVMWSLAGALYPAVDLCAGEKERGTMETLLISPASREEIVWGKFLTIWVFSAATALLNLLSMALTSSQLGAFKAGMGFQVGAFFWGVLLLLPLSAFFSAVCLAVGAYARSSKEGQYYLMPLFLITMPLIFLTLAPGIELNPFYSMVPVTGVALLLQRLVMVDTPDRGLWLYFVPVLAPMMIYSWLALRWAIYQFQREEVLFREAERLEVGLWLKRLLREKEPLPSTGEAFFCFALILALRWFSFGVGEHLSLLTRTGIGHLAFVATPPLIMAVLLTTKPWRGLGLLLPPWWAWPGAVLLAILVVPPLAELTLFVLRQFPALLSLLELNHPLTRELRSLTSGQFGAEKLHYFLILAFLPAICEELAFRGFILQGLLRTFRPWTAIFLSAFLFSLYQMNVFQFLPHFVFGMVLALIVVRTGSIWPAMLFHLIYNSLVIAPALFPEWFTFFASVAPTPESRPDLTLGRILFSTVCAVLAILGLGVISWLGRSRQQESVA